MMVYKLNLAPQEMKNLGFRYDKFVEDYVYEFPVYKNRNKTMITCKIWIEEDAKKVCCGVYDMNKNLYSSYYNRDYGISKVVDVIDKNIVKELLRIGAEEVNE